MGGITLHRRGVREKTNEAASPANRRLTCEAPGGDRFCGRWTLGKRGGAPNNDSDGIKQEIPPKKFDQGLGRGGAGKTTGMSRLQARPETIGKKKRGEKK